MRRERWTVLQASSCRVGCVPRSNLTEGKDATKSRGPSEGRPPWTLSISDKAWGQLPLFCSCFETQEKMSRGTFSSPALA